jgi:AcrR family transcriptional regulator
VGGNYGTSRDPRKKERILAAAEEVFSKRGYTQSTLDEIIKIADTGKGTVYKYFGKAMSQQTVDK